MNFDKKKMMTRLSNSVYQTIYYTGITDMNAISKNSESYKIVSQIKRRNKTKENSR